MNRKTFTLDDLCLLTDLPRRTVRYYVQIGLVEPPEGETRAARYSETQLGQLIRIKQLSAAGVSLERIREVIAGGEAPVAERRKQPGSVEVRSHLYVAPGIEILICPGDAGMTPAQVREFVREVMQAAEKVLGKDAQPPLRD